MKLDAYRANGFSVLNFLGNDAKAPQVEALRYIERMATLTQTDIDDWDLKEIFGTGEGNAILTDRGEINQRFFAKKETIPKKQIVIPNLPEQAIASLKKMRDARQANLKIDLEARMRDTRTAMKRYVDTVNTYVKTIAQLNEEMEALDLGGGFNATGEVEKAIKPGFWRLWDVGPEWIDFVTVHELTAQQRNRAAGIDIQLNMGKFRCRLHFANYVVQVFPHSNNFKVQGYYHPHVYGDGSICWGTAGQMALDNFAKGTFSTTLNLLGTILVNHNHDSPVYSLAKFVNQPKFNPQEPECPLDIKAKIEKETPEFIVESYEEEEEYEEEFCSGCDEQVEDCACEDPDAHDTYKGQRVRMVTKTRQIARNRQEEAAAGLLF